MSSVAIYMEGGGSGSGTKAALRRGMDALLGPLKQAARNKSMHWKLVPCGPRGEAFRSFRNAARDADGAIVLLLVDAEGPVATGPCEHLQARDGWDMAAVAAQTVHLDGADDGGVDRRGRGRAEAVLRAELQHGAAAEGDGSGERGQE